MGVIFHLHVYVLVTETPSVGVSRRDAAFPAKRVATKFCAYFRFFRRLRRKMRGLGSVGGTGRTLIG